MTPISDNKAVKYNSMFLGSTMFLFGFLKFFDPFRSWFDVQITKSGLPRLCIPMGIAGEISIGLGLLSAARVGRETSNLVGPIASAASAGLIANMAGATYVHVHPEVPANVLPLKIKPPIIPLVFMLLAAVNLVQLRRDHGQRS
ncbi:MULTISPECIES: hypothetical protein [unclassified Mycobacterium]|uniref:hypothetical protein n=1 Tax=unclassified Mycobacterium TaxID=2642494 RepID=UPI0007FF0E02|nr:MULTISPECIES: hypothetical protein [unclassified Mycobacterium]OBG54866.1 hypothetical protein A5703_08380 [Mycobacterium sp. E188]OBG77412.1 hypothetical protein A5701_17230 [Mycobacterium sp. E3305]OBH42172.1 hypothetical protein A5691_18365 [Mycobacterium sp. E183]